MRKITLTVELDTKSIDDAIEKIRTLKKELRILGLPYDTGDPLSATPAIIQQEKRN